MSRFVLDASALRASLNVEPGAERVADILLDGQVVLLSVNLTETLGKLADWALPLDAAAARIEALKLPVECFDQTLAIAAELRAPTRHLGLSLGDRACLALARQLNATAITADRPWTRLDPGLGIQIECIRSDNH